MAHDALERPAERGRGRLVAGEQQRHQLVAQLGVGQRLSVLVARGEQQREDVVALGGVRSARRAADLARRRRRRPAPSARGSGPTGCAGCAPSELVSCSSSSRAWLAVASSMRAQRRGRGARPRGRRRTPKTARRITSSVIACIDGWVGKRLPTRPARHVALGDLAHRLAVGAHALAVEGRQHQAALAQVLGAVEQQHRARAEQRLAARRCRRPPAAASGSPVKTRLTVSGSDVITTVRPLLSGTVKASP